MVVLERVGNDLQVRTETVQSRPPKLKTTTTPRPRSATYGKASRTRLRNAVRGVMDAASFITFTFPAIVVADEACVRRAWDRMRRYLLERGASGVMAIEFTSAGVPHIHVVTDLSIGTRELAAAWARILQVDDDATVRHAVLSQYVHSTRKLADYMSKPTSKIAPEGFQVGRWWSSFGPQRPSKPKLVLRAARSALEVLLWTLWNQRPGGRPPRTPGGTLPPRFQVPNGVNENWALLSGLGLVE